MSDKTMAEVLAEHRISVDFTCECGADFYPNTEDGGVTDEQEAERNANPDSFIKSFESHQAAALTAAGFGLVADAKAEALWRVERLAARWATLADGDKYYARHIRAALDDKL